MIARGVPEEQAAHAVCVPRSTLRRRYLETLGPNAPNKDEARKAADERIMANAYAVAEQTLGRMADEVDDADAKTLTAWADASSRVLSRLRGWDRGIPGDAPTDRFAAVIERVLAQGGATLSVSLTPNEQREQTLTIDLPTNDE